jgi:hypothetical protein
LIKWLFPLCLAILPHSIDHFVANFWPVCGSVAAGILDG